MLIKVLTVLTISINHIISSHRVGGYNLSSLRNLRQNQAEKVETLGMMDNSKASKYRKILTNWFICNGLQGKEKSLPKNGLHEKGKCNEGRKQQPTGGLLQVLQTDGKVRKSLDAKPATSPLRWLLYLRNTLQCDKLSFSF